jgi:D-alanyl-lipoteichoic acid acyltransferase DltB (MBOAT superfamily)
MGLGGLWHGANLTFVIWGLLHGAALVVERMLGITGEKETRRRLPAWLTWFVTLHFVCLTWVFFRSPTLEVAQTYLTTLVSGEAIFTTTVTPLFAAIWCSARSPRSSPTTGSIAWKPITTAPRSPGRSRSRSW